MGLFDWFRRVRAAPVVKTGTSPEDWFEAFGVRSAASGGIAVTQYNAMTASPVYACVTIRSEDTARCTPRLYKPGPNGERTQIFDHPVAKLLRKPNRIQTWFEFCEQMEASLLLKGNGIAVILTDARGRPTELIPINPDYCAVLESTDGSIFYRVMRNSIFLRAVLSGLPLEIAADDIFHLRGHTFNSLVGASRIGLASSAIGLAINLLQQAVRWISNGARPAGILTSPKAMSEEAGKRLLARFTSLFSGTANAGSTALLEEGVDWKQLQMNSVDLEFINQRNLQVEDIARFYRVPPHKLAKTDGLRGLNLPQADQEYVNDAIMPALERWEQKFAYCFGLDDQGLEVDFDESNLLRADITTRYNAYRIGLLSGIVSTNEVRRAEKLPPVDGGDEVRVPLNMAALGSDMTGTAPDGAGRPNDGELPADAVPTN